MAPSVAYDLEAFAPREQRERLRVAPRTRKPLAKNLFRMVQIVAVTALVLALVCSVLASRITITELTAEIAQEETNLSTLKSEYAYLSTELGRRTNLKTLEEIAKSELNLFKPSQSQITYINRKSETVIVKPDTKLDKVIGSVSTNVMSFMEYLAP